MSPLKEGLLEKGSWEEIETQTETTASSQKTKWLSYMVRPSFLSKTCARNVKLRRTAYLDGLRGFAALLVYIGHHQLWAHDSLKPNPESVFESGFGYDKRYYLCTFPGLRTFFSGGHFAVSVFFVISGYVLSAKPLSLIQAARHDQLAENLGSSLFRRWPRLFIPVICTTFLSFSMWHAFGILANFEPQSSFSWEVWLWYVEFKNYSFVFRTGGEPWLKHNYQTWSIPVEFKGSICVYTALLAFSRCRKNARLLCEIVVIFYFMYIADGAHFSLFMMGMLLCDLDLLAAKKELPSLLSSLEDFKKPIMYTMLIVSILLGGVPTVNRDVTILRATPGWHYLSFLKPQAVYDYQWFYLFWAATFMVTCVPRLPWLKAFFESKPNQYLGRISYAFYLVHGPILWTLGDRVYAAVGHSRESHALAIPGWINRFPLPRWGPLGLEPSFILPHIILLPITFWVAEIVTTVIDEPSIKFSQWMYKKTLEQAPKL